MRESFRNFKKYFIITNVCVIFYEDCGKLTKKQPVPGM